MLLPQMLQGPKGRRSQLGVEAERLVPQKGLQIGRGQA